MEAPLRATLKVAAAPDDPGPLSAGHGTSLSTTAGITAVISGMATVALFGQCPAATAPLAARALSAGAATLLMLAAIALYAARNGVGEALDRAGGPGAGVLAARALIRYHAGMASFFGGLALAAAWRLGTFGGLAALVALGMAGAAIKQTLRWRAIAQARRSA